jgi:molecular chaperone DnaJ
VPPQREWFDKDYYSVLGVSQNATEKELTRAYRKLAKQYHPDTNPGAEERFKEITAAYDVVGDPEKRKEYDEVRKLGPMGAQMRGGFGGGPGNATFRIDDLGDLGDLLARREQRCGHPRQAASRLRRRHPRGHHRGPRRRRGAL